jgi:uncharacterized RDD family membrane protein YckC
MNWYYVENGQQAGPVDDAQLEALRSSGTIQPDTLIWSEGMANWQAYAQVKGAPAAVPGAVPVGAAASAIPVATPLGTAVASPVSEAVCAECGGVFNIQDTIAYGGVRVCARCKPIFMQKLAEGAKLHTGVLSYAGFWTRFAAVFLDGIMLGVVNMVLNFVFIGAMTSTARPNSPGALGMQLVLMFFQIAIALSYETFMIGKYGATLGKMALKIQVVTAEGGKVSYLRALGRYFAKMLSGLTCLIGYLMAAWDDQKRTLHDRICDTRVVMK